ncbi:hypothetical protein [Psychroflexus montanilacus]|uniref:hypothetical protein n=1 Tax=Psychroflexus montanilacus TaxID=2873598 RepID=UPI001CCF0456|nr:hypothetical protein [Psychroflexus montanilacus]MBZ9652656.1 hypothetical protein [Psychroflexus montanilacus]
MRNEEFTIDNFEDFDVKYLIGYSKEKNKIARFFENRYESTSSSYLSTIKVFVGCEIESCDFAIEIYSVGENDDPRSQINNKEIVGYAEEGKNWTTIDVLEHLIKFPKQGLFVVLKWLKTEENLYEYSGHKKNREKRYTYSTYAPQFGTIPSESEFLWVYENETWEKAEKNKLSLLQRYEGKHSVPAIKLLFDNL